jgi:hypothetical protein
MNNTTTAARRQFIRRYPAWKINGLIRAAGFKHLDIAKRAGVHESQVSHTILRRRVGTPACERVWAVLERIL